MSFPFIFEENFELGTLGDFDVESDTGSRLDFPLYAELARYPGLGMPWRGAYCMRVDLSPGVADAYVQEATDFDTALGDPFVARFMVWVDPKIQMAVGDEFAVFELWSGTNTPEVSIMVHNNSGVLEWAVNETRDPSGASTQPLILGAWTAIEVSITLDDGVSDDGIIDVWIDRAALVQITGADQAAITSGVFGVLGQDVGTTKGYVLFDSIIVDDARIYAPRDRFSELITLTKSGHAFVGRGTIDNVTLNSGTGTESVLRIYDTDVADTTDFTNVKVELKNTAGNEVVDPAGMPVSVRRGCFVELSGTAPKATLKICKAPGAVSEAVVRSIAARRA